MSEGRKEINISKTLHVEKLVIVWAPFKACVTILRGRAVEQIWQFSVISTKCETILCHCSMILYISSKIDHSNKDAKLFCQASLFSKQSKI